MADTTEVLTPETGSVGSTPALDLISRVAIERIKAAQRAAQAECVRFAVVGFDTATLPILQALAAADLDAQVWASEVWRAPAGGRVQSTDEPPGHFRDLTPAPGVRAIIFAPSVQEVQSSQTTLRTVSRVAPDVLKQDIDLWIRVADPEEALSPVERTYFRMVLQGLVGTEILTRIEVLGAFMAALTDNWTSRPPHQAVAEALPAIRIPRGAGKFKAPGARGAPRAAKSWASELQDLHNRATDLAFLRNDRAQPLDRAEIRARCDDLEALAEITAEDARIIRNLLDDSDIMPGEWRETQSALIGLDWGVLQRVFRTPKAKTRTSIAEDTEKFFELYEPDQLDEEDRALLALVDETRPATPEEKNFFDRVRTSLRQDPPILKRWVRFIYARAREHQDLLVGVLAATLELLPDLQPDTVLLLRAPGSERMSFWEDHAREVTLLLRDRYRGLGQTMGPRVKVDFGQCWARTWEEKASAKERPSRDAYQMKFELHALLPSDIDAEGRVSAVSLLDRPRRQFVWTPAAHSLALAFSANLKALQRRDGGVELLAGRYARTVKGARMRPLPVKLSDTRSFLDTEENDAGVLFNPNDAPMNVGRRVREELSRLEREGALSRDEAMAVGEALTAFETSYAAAIAAFSTDEGIGAQPLIDQADRFGELLDALRRHAHNDAARHALWAPLARLGLALPRNGEPGSIITPFAPFRLAEIGLKARSLAEILADILANPSRPGADDFLTQAQEDLAGPWFSDVAVVPTTDEALHLMAEQVTEGDFGLLEPVEPDAKVDQPDTYSREAAQRLLEACLEYLDLHPYDASNFSLALYNGQSREMPGLMAELLGKRIEDDNDLRCEMIVTHDDRNELRRIYTEQNMAIGSELDAVTADSGRTFLSRLRVGFLDSTALANAGAGRPGLDIAFLQDVIGRHAQLAWRPAQPPAGGWPALDTALRGNRSRRLAPDPGQRSTRVLLCAPLRPRPFQAYLNFAKAVFEDAAVGPLEQDFEPLKAVAYDHAQVRPVIAKAHESADWVVTFDPIADRQLFVHNGISIISFAPSRSSRNNLIISTRSHSQALIQRLQGVIAEIQGRPVADTAPLAKQLISQAADLSGRIVLRAANNHKNALELIGVVLAHQLATQALEPAQLATWLFVDDLKSSLGHAPGDELADLAAIALEERDGQARVELLVVEAKFVEAAGIDGAAEKSGNQLRSTVERMQGRFGGGPNDLNRMVHLSRLADLMIEQAKRPRLAEGYLLRDWAERIRRGEVQVGVRGLSTIFLHDEDIPPEATRDLELNARQVFFDRSAIDRMLSELEGGARLTVVPTLPQDEAGGGTPPSSPAEEQSPTPLDAAGEATPSASMPQAPEAPKSEPIPPATEATTPATETVAAAPAGFRRGVAQLVAAQAPAAAEVEGERWLADTIKGLQSALRGYGMTSDVVGSRLTPNAALVRLRGGEKMTVALVEKRRETLLTSHGLDVVAVRPGSREVVIMIARPQRVILPTLGLWKRRSLPETAPTANTSFVLGEREDNGEILYLNLGRAFAGQPQHGPHTLIAGETGGGKGVFTANLLLDICATNAPSEARIWLVDPKAGIDYSWIEHTPHLEGSILTTPEGGMGALKALVEEMERRYAEVLAPTKSPNLDIYNARATAADRLPRIYFFHDELADWMADKSDGRYRDAVSDYVVRLSGKARAAGIHLFLITQRPDKDALPGLIKANMNNKIALKVSNKLNSQIILDESGAEGLLGQGQMIAKLANQPGGLIYAQAPYLAPEEAAAVAEAIARD